MSHSSPVVRLAHVFLLLLLCVANAQAQRKPERQLRNYTPGGLLDNAFDNLGNQFTLGQIAISDGTRTTATGYKTTTSVASCSSGYFRLYLENGCGMEGTDAASAARLTVLCQVLRDISQLIISPCTATGQKVNIWVKKSITGGAGGVATPFYNVPRSTTASGITDNTIWLTINSGKDAFINVTAPLSTSGGGSTGSTFFHGSIAFNFSGSISWHTDLSTPTAAGKYDLYTVALHEMLHAMGFGTLIDYNGNSVLGTEYKYYTRYDRQLQTPAGTKLVTTTTPSPGCGMYNWAFNTTLTPVGNYLSPGGTAACPSGYTTGPSADHTVCSSGLQYSGLWPTAIPVYTPQCFEKGSSLSHFEDECYVPAGFVLGVAGAATNNHYFVMSNAGAVGPYNATTNLAPMKRYPTPEERSALCDMGYKVNVAYGSAANLTYKYYGGTVYPGLQVAGVNDGILLGGTYAYTALPTISVNINAGASGFLANDFGAASFKCLEVVNGTGALSATSGTGTTDVYFTADAGSYGVQLLRYVPVSSTGAEGNITYIYVYVNSWTCNPSACNIIANGGFEDGTMSFPGSLSGISCWDYYAESPDWFTKGCTGSPWCFPGSWFFDDGGHANSLTGGANDHYMGIVSGNWDGVHSTEAFQGRLGSSLLAGNTYLVSFWARLAPAGINWQTFPAKIQIAVGPNAPLLPYAAVLNSLPAALTPLCDFTITYPDTAGWHYYSKYITYTGPAVNALVVTAAPWLNPTTGVYADDYAHYVAFDDISILPIAEVCTFQLPDTISNPSFINLDSTVNIPGGKFSWKRDSSGVAVTTNNGLFTAGTAYKASLIAGNSGKATVCYTYSTALGCDHVVCEEVYVKPPPTGIPMPAQNAPGLRVVPNPNNGTFVLEGTVADGATTATIEIADPLGRVVYSTVGPVNNNTLYKQIVLSPEMPNGIYFVKVNGGNSSQVVRLLVNR